MGAGTPRDVPGISVSVSVTNPNPKPNPKTAFFKKKINPERGFTDTLASGFVVPLGKLVPWAFLYPRGPAYGLS